jgi:hypothetical protein
MSVLARDLDAYNRALQAYQRKVGTFNKGVDQYNASVMKDPAGNTYVYGGEYDPLGPNSGQFYTADKTSGNLSEATAPAGYAGMTGIPDSPGYSMLRQNPTGKETKIFTGAIKSGGGTDRFGNPQPEYFYIPGEPSPDGLSTSKRLDASKVRVVGQTEGQRSGMGGGSNPTYTIEYDINSFQDKPGEWTETFDKTAPDPTKAQVAQAVRPSLAEQEAGLIGEVIKGKGLKTGSGGLIGSRMAADDSATTDPDAVDVVKIDSGGGKPGTKTPVMVR